VEHPHAALEGREILSEPYSGHSFPGFDSVDLSFEELETLIFNERLPFACMFVLLHNPIKCAAKKAIDT